MRIGELSKVTGVSIATIRLYEREGLIDRASRTEGRFREFTREQERRLDFIKRVRNLGFSLEDVKALLMLADTTRAATASELIQRLLNAIAFRRHDLDQLENHLQKISTGGSPLKDVDGAFSEAVEAEAACFSA